MTPDEQIELHIHMGARRYGLSPRQTNVFQQMARGCANADEIGAALGIAHKTVDNALGLALRKLDARDSHQAMTRLLGLGSVES